MPYIPPPPRPPAPPRIAPPPVFRPPQQNFAFQQQQRIQQQQRFQQQQQHFHQQQRFHQQQIFQAQQRHQEQIRRVNQNLQMENMRRQQLLQQQQQQRQQQQQQFQRQQDEFRRHQQQQDHLRRQQQDNLRRQEQQRQQALLRNVQRSSAINGGSTVVHVAPGITFEMSGINVSPGTIQINNGVEVTGNGIQQQNGEPAGVSIPAAANGQPQQVPPTTPGGPAVGPPPPYSGQLTATPPPTQPTAQAPPPSALAPPPSAQAHPPPGPVADNRVILKDGTQIVLHQEDEILFIGPTGVQMVVNCLPLYQPPDEEAQASADGSQEPLSPSRSSKLIKARSMESISSSLLGDDEGPQDTKTVGEVATPPRTKSSKFSHYSVTVHNVLVSEPAAASNGGGIHEKKQQSVEGDNSGEKSQTTEASQGEVSAASTEDADKTKDNDGKKTTDEGVSSSGETAAAVGSSDDVIQAENDDSKTNSEKSKETSTIESKEAKKEEQESDLVSDGSAAERKTEPREAGNKFENSEEVKSKIEVNVVEAEQQKHIKLQKTRSERASLSPDGDLSDSEDNGFAVNYVQDPFVVPQLKRSSGSVSFYAPNIPTVAVTEITSVSSAHSVRDETLLEMSAENKLDTASLDKSEEASTTATDGDKTDGASGEGGEEPAGREKSLSTAKPPILVETNTILQQSASSGPTAPAQATPPPTASPPPSSSPEAKAQAPPTPSAVLRATPLPGPPVTLDQDYTERSGWLNKLSHRKGMFGDKWQKRYFVLHRSWLYYFKKYGDSNPRGVIRLLPTGWCRPISQGARRMSDAVINKTDQGSAVISVLRCFAVHRPNNFAASLSALLGTEGVAEAFRSQTVSISNAQHMSRTFYMTAASNEERDAWITTINNNVKAYAHSGEALDTACKELKKMLRAVQSNIAQKDIPSVLLLLTVKMKKVIEQESTRCSGSS